MQQQGFDPPFREIAHTTGHLSLCAATTEPRHPERVLRDRRGHAVRGPHITIKSSPHSQQLEKTCPQHEDPGREEGGEGERHYLSKV